MTSFDIRVYTCTEYALFRQRVTPSPLPVFQVMSYFQVFRLVLHSHLFFLPTLDLMTLLVFGGKNKTGIVIICNNFFIALCLL